MSLGQRIGERKQPAAGPVGEAGAGLLGHQAGGGFELAGVESAVEGLTLESIDLSNTSLRSISLRSNGGVFRSSTRSKYASAFPVATCKAAVAAGDAS